MNTDATSPPKRPKQLKLLRVRGQHRTADPSLRWMERDYPEMQAWRELALAWLAGQTKGLGIRLHALNTFIERFIVKHSLPVDPLVFLSRKTLLPDFFETSCVDSASGVNYNNIAHDFLDFVLARECSEPDDHGRPVVLAAFHNPVARRSLTGYGKLDESVRSPLPYGYIDELRGMLAQGPNFRDWAWAQDALGAQFGAGGTTAPGWFPVSPEQIDESDPDCVWRIRDRHRKAGGPVLEMWSPVRWVCLLVKLILPLRTMQVRMLDSGEADTFRYTGSADSPWSLANDDACRHLRRLAGGTSAKPRRQGVFRRSNPLTDGESVSTVLYVNTNKTADSAVSGSEKGYVMPWVSGGPPHQDGFYWLEKLCNWQTRYNPLAKLTSWTELDGRHMGVKSEVQLAGYPDTCFLFRLREAASPDERHLPVTEAMARNAWFFLLESLEEELAKRNETHRNGQPIRLLKSRDEVNSHSDKTTLYPLHSLRVSLVTALALEGQVPFPILQKLVGHSRLLMTIYYTKPGASHIREVLSAAAERLDATKEANIQDFLLNTDHATLMREAICNSAPSLAQAISEHPASRNLAGWMPMHHGMCLVGGNTSEQEGSRQIGGCHNGGPANLGVQRGHGPVPGGPRNCVRCRWFVTRPDYLPALAAHFNVLAYHFDETRNGCIATESQLQALKREKIEAEDAGLPFGRMDAFRTAERVWESSMAKFSGLAEDLAACYRLTERCQKALAADGEGATKLIAAGTVTDVQIACSETDSELLQLSGVCESAEVYQDLDHGKAVFRRSQLLDAALVRDGRQPVFMMLTEAEQLSAGNAFMRRLAESAAPDSPALGRRQVIQLVDAGYALSERLGVDLASLVPGRGGSVSAQPVSLALLRAN